MNKNTTSITLFASCFIALWYPLTVISEQPVPAPTAEVDTVKQQVINRLSQIIIPMVNLEDAKLEEAIDFIRMRTRELDTEEKEPTMRGMNCKNLTPEKTPDPLAPKESSDTEAKVAPVIKKLYLNNVPAISSLKYICMLTNMKLSIGKYALEITPSSNGDLGLVNEIDPQAKALLQQQIKEITIPSLRLANVTLDEAISLLRLRSAELSPQKYVNFIIMRNNDEREQPNINQLNLRNATLENLLIEICKQTNHSYDVHEAAIILSPIAEKTTEKK